MQFSLRSLGALVLLNASFLTAQNPFPRAGDPGPLGTNVVVPGGASYQVANGYRLNHLLSLNGLVGSAADFVVGVDGDLFVSRTAGTPCGAPASVHITRIAMQNGTPVIPAVATQFTTQAIPAFELDYDPVSQRIFATGTCAQTNSVYNIAGNGVPQLASSGSSFNDPDSVAFGYLPGTATPALYVAAQDALHVIDLSTNPFGIATISVDLSALGLSLLGNWGSILYDANTRTLLGTGVGAPSVYRSVEITLGGQFPNLTGSVTSIFPTTLRPLAVDYRGARIFEQSTQIGYLNPGNVFTPFLSGLSGASIEPAADGSLLILDQFVGNLLRLEPTLSSQMITASSAEGGSADIKLQGGVTHANDVYLLLMGVSGAGAGSPVGAAVNLPLIIDPITQFLYSLTLAGTPGYADWTGLLDAQGRGRAIVPIGAGVVPPGTTLSFAALFGGPLEVSNAVWIHVL